MKIDAPRDVPLAPGKRLVLQQLRIGSDVILGAAAATRYALCSEDGAELGRVVEVEGGCSGSLLTWVFTSGRPFRFLVEAGGRVTLDVRRPWFWFLSTAFVADGDGGALGRLQQRLTLAGRHFEIFAADGRRLGEIVGPWRRPWTFEVLVDGGVVAAIEKRWPRIEDLLSGANAFSLTLPASGDPVLSRLVLAAALLIDFCYFERGTAGVLGSGG